MEGATHTENEHKKLYYISQLPKIDGNIYEDFLNSQIVTPGGGCSENQNQESCGPGYYWAGEPICGCIPLESEHHSNEEETQEESPTQSPTQDTTPGETSGY